LKARFPEYEASVQPTRPWCSLLKIQFLIIYVTFASILIKQLVNELTNTLKSQNN
jgi:hypothetical protein